MVCHTEKKKLTQNISADMKPAYDLLMFIVV